MQWRPATKHERASVLRRGGARGGRGGGRGGEEGGGGGAAAGQRDQYAGGASARVADGSGSDPLPGFWGGADTRWRWRW